MKVTITMYDAERDQYYNFTEDLPTTDKHDFVKSLKDGRFFPNPFEQDNLFWFPYHQIIKVEFP